MSEITVSREELYKMLWEMPMKQVIDHYDTSYHHLRKFCDEYKVPTPPSGYWKQVELGKELPVQPPLKPYNYEKGRLRTGFKRETELDRARLERVRKISSGFEKFKVPERLARPHPIVSVFFKGVYNSRHYNHENQKQYEPPFSPETHRALRILDTFLKALEAKGYSFEEDQNWWIYGQSGSHKIHFRFREQYRQVKITHPKRTSFATEIERKLYHLMRRESSVTLEPKGIVEFTSDRLSLWADKETKPLEEQLPQLLLNVLLDRDRAEHEAILAREREKERDERAAIREAERRRKAQDQASLDAFTSMATAWETKGKLQSFYFALRSLPDDGSTVIGERSIDEWKAWLEQKIAAMDPLRNGAEEVFRRLERVRNVD
ncbi:hypothetical protein [Phyllobacterium meliloti]|uniref:hypothetical protein n=1 Tax=Phyllobacterium meliloti TaxID=555317 RepID=UPI001D14A24E|nr:hypothetical protein [Phyllobacterium sp. T1293]UGX87152.1 hypothetical protein LLE53_004705 [Phyllobacterium sp. T1293]